MGQGYLWVQVEEHAGKHQHLIDTCCITADTVYVRGLAVGLGHVQCYFSCNQTRPPGVLIDIVGHPSFEYNQASQLLDVFKGKRQKFNVQHEAYVNLIEIKIRPTQYNVRCSKYIYACT